MVVQDLGSRADFPAGEQHVTKPRGTTKTLSKGGTGSDYHSTFATFSSEVQNSRNPTFHLSQTASQDSNTPTAFSAFQDSHIPTAQDLGILEFQYRNTAFQHSTALSPSLKRCKLPLSKLPAFQESDIPALSPNTPGYQYSGVLHSWVQIFKCRIPPF